MLVCHIVANVFSKSFKPNHLLTHVCGQDVEIGRDHIGIEPPWRRDAGSLCNGVINSGPPPFCACCHLGCLNHADDVSLAGSSLNYDVLS